MAYEVVISIPAERDLIAIRQYIADQNPEAAPKFIDRLIAEANSLATFPDRGGRLANSNGVRFTVLGRYMIVYRVLESHKKVSVLRFWHTARERRRF